MERVRPERGDFRKAQCRRDGDLLAQPVTKASSTTADPDLLAKVATGEMPSFFVDRQPGDKGAECAKLSKGVIYDLGTKINQDP